MTRRGKDELNKTIKLFINAYLVANSTRWPSNSFIFAFLSFFFPWFTNLPNRPDSLEASILKLGNKIIENIHCRYTYIYEVLSTNFNHIILYSKRMQTIYNDFVTEHVKCWL